MQPEYDAENDLWYIEGTKTPFTGLHERYEDFGESKETLCRMVGYLENGKMDGIWKVYNVLENLSMEMSYKNGVLDGPCKGFHLGGQLLCEFAYKNGKEDGTWVWYKEDGSFDKSKSFINGEQLN